MRHAFVVAVAMAATVASARAETGSNGRWCLSTFTAGENVNCSFQTLAQCNASKTANKDSCSRNPRFTTTGSGTAGKPGRKK